MANAASIVGRPGVTTRFMICKTVESGLWRVDCGEWRSGEWTVESLRPRNHNRMRNHYHPIGHEICLNILEFTNVSGIPYLTDIRDFSSAKETHHGGAETRRRGSCKSDNSNILFDYLGD